MNSLEFTQKTLPDLAKEYEWEDYQYKTAEYYVKDLNKITVYQLTQEQKQDFISTDYAEFVEDIEVGEWVMDDDEVCYKIDELVDWQIEVEANMKEGYSPDVSRLLQVLYTYHLQEQIKS